MPLRLWPMRGLASRYVLKVISVGRSASQIIALQREPYPASTRNPYSSQNLHDFYRRREQAHEAKDKNAEDLAMMRKLEHQRLFGYVITIDGRTLTTEDALRRLEHGKLTKHEILEWHNPEIYCDEVLSVGERDSLDTFPALQIDRGDVLHDPKIPNYQHPSLRGR